MQQHSLSRKHAYFSHKTYHEKYKNPQCLVQLIMLEWKQFYDWSKSLCIPWDHIFPTNSWPLTNLSTISRQLVDNLIRNKSSLPLRQLFDYNVSTCIDIIKCRQHVDTSYNFPSQPICFPHMRYFVISTRVRFTLDESGSSLQDIFHSSNLG